MLNHCDGCARKLMEIWKSLERKMENLEEWKKEGMEEGIEEKFAMRKQDIEFHRKRHDKTTPPRQPGR